MNSIESLVNLASTSSVKTEGGVLSQAPAAQGDAAALNALRSLIAASPDEASQVPVFEASQQVSEMPQGANAGRPNLDISVSEQKVASLVNLPEGFAPQPVVMEAIRAYFSVPSPSPHSSQAAKGAEAVKISLPLESRLFLQTGQGAEAIPANLLPVLTEVRAALSSGLDQASGQTSLAGDWLVKLQALIKPETQPLIPPDTVPALGPDLVTGTVYAAQGKSGENLGLTDSANEDSIEDILPDEMHSSVPLNLGHAILQSLDSQSSVTSPPATSLVDPSVHVQRLEQVSALMAEMADRVLVTDPLHGQTQEVRIKLADHMIPDTEVRVWHGEGGQLRVEFETTSGYWARVLNEATPQLAQRLNDKLVLPEAALVSVSQQGGQPGDGRSRNRQSPWDLAATAQEP